MLKWLWLLFVLPSAVTACGQSPADIVASTRHCGGVLVRPDILMRLSSYQPKQDSIMMWVVQACHPAGGCLPVMTYHHALPPVYSITPDGSLQIEILGGFIEDFEREEIVRDGVKIPIIVNHHRGKRSDAEIDRFRARLGLPPGKRARDKCDPALEARQSFSA